MCFAALFLVRPCDFCVDVFGSPSQSKSDQDKGERKAVPFSAGFTGLHGSVEQDARLVCLQ